MLYQAQKSSIGRVISSTVWLCFHYMHEHESAGDGLICVRHSVGTWGETNWMYSKDVFVREGKGGYVVRNNVCLLEVVGICLALLLFILNPFWLCNVETERALAQNAELDWLVAIQYPEYHGAVFRAKHAASLFINRKMKNLEQTVPDLWPWKIICSGHLSVFLSSPPKPHTTNCGPMVTSLSTLK